MDAICVGVDRQLLDYVGTYGCMVHSWVHIPRVYVCAVGKHCFLTRVCHIVE